MPEEPLDDPRLHAFCQRLLGTTRSMKLKSKRLSAEQDELMDKWTEVLDAEQELEGRFGGNK